MGRAQVPREAREPGEQAEVHDHRGGQRPRRRVGRRVARGARLQGQAAHLPRLAAPRAQHRRAGRDQRGEELPQRRRQHPAPLLRHDQGRRLPRPRGQRLPARADEREHHRPVRRAGRPVRPRVRRPARQPLVRRRPGQPHVLRPGPDRPAAAARRVPGARPPGAPRQRRALRAHRDARPRGEGRAGGRRRRPQPDHRRGALAVRPRGRARHRRLRQRLLPLDERQGEQRHRDLAGPPARRARWPTRASPRSTRRASRRATTSSRSSR